MTPSTRRVLRAGLLVAGAGMLLAPIAAVATARPPAQVRDVVAHAVAVPSAVTKTNWWYDDPSALVAPVTAPPATPTTVPQGDLGVGYRNGPPANALPVPVAYPAAEADKQAFVSVDLGGVPAGSTVTAFSLRVVVDTAGDPASAIDLLNPAGPPVLIACPAVRDWDPGAGPSRWDALPATDCSSPVKGTFDGASSSYTFSSPALAQSWLDDENDGLAILPDPGTTAGFTLSLAGASQMKVSLAVEAPLPSSTPRPHHTAAVAPPVATTPAAPP
ncbi:MAG TPA: hypothetical protein VHE83_14150, partial [Mycobacteriales bacterium]|nr:hypothetical protein [Mycobacteriales bacterium]